MIWAAYAIGAFYVFAGLVAINAGRTSLFLDDALKKLVSDMAETMYAAPGIGLAADDPRAMQPGEWNGLNLLGFALMRARATLASAGTP